MDVYEVVSGDKNIVIEESHKFLAVLEAAKTWDLHEGIFDIYCVADGHYMCSYCWDAECFFSRIDAQGGRKNETNVTGK